MSHLAYQREELNKLLDSLDAGFIVNRGLTLDRLVKTWWLAYKAWEKQDTFDAAFADDRMTVRTFGTDFNYEHNKRFDTIDVASNRFYADSKYTPFPNDRGQRRDEQMRHSDIIKKTAEGRFYHAERGIDSSAFAIPSNFLSREKKYEMGLHDLSASLLNHNHLISQQIHHKDLIGTHFSFLPLSAEEDQEVLYRLTQRAKDKVTFPSLYSLVREIRAEMTRLKVADDADLGTGYTATPVPLPANECSGMRPAYKLRYGLKTSTMTPTGQTTLEIRKQAARRFKQILAANAAAKNEVIIAIRKHAGPFPVYAVRNNNVLHCYDIVGNQMVLNGKQISMNGHLT